MKDQLTQEQIMQELIIQAIKNGKIVPLEFSSELH